MTPSSPTSGFPTAAGPLAAGQEFGTRYHIIRLLGAGGMGAVYQAWDAELGVAVAIKVIRPEVTADPFAAAALERRFKRELLLARQITHRNVVRIHDLGDINGIKYITMPYINGSDLATVLKKNGKLSVPVALKIAKQLVEGLQAAHEAGVVHRDLKPANIMLEDDHVLIMDFGIARSMEAGGGTMAGGIIGTVEYMAPEQAKGEPVDHRADLYAVGLMLYDMLLGRRRVSASNTAVAELMQRMQQTLPAPASLDPDIPAALDAIIVRCLQLDPNLRYQTTAELAAELNALDADGHALAPLVQSYRKPHQLTGATWRRRLPRGPARTRALAVLAGAAIAAVATIVTLQNRRSEPGATPAARSVSLAILPFRNASGDQSLSWLGPNFAEMLRSELGQSTHLRTVSPERLQQILRDLNISPDSSLDPAALRRLAQLTSSDTVLWGQFVKFGNEIRIDTTLEDVQRGRATPLVARAATEGMLLGTVAELAESIRENLAFTPDIVKELQTKTLRPSSQSLPAIRAYNVGMQLVRQGKTSDALKQFQASTEADANFALAYSRLSQAYATLGYDNEAEQSSRKALDLSEGLPPGEKYLIQASHARILNDTKKAVESYENLLKASPDDPQTQFELARLYEETGALDQARGLYGKVVERDGSYMDALLALGRVEIRRRNPQASLDHLNRALSLAIQLDSQEPKANILNAIGIAYKRLDKPADALRYYMESLDIKRRLGQKGGIANTLNEIAQVQLALGKPDEAFKSYQEALQLRREIGDTRGIGNNLLDLGVFHSNRGEYDEALKLYKESLQIWRQVGNQSYEAITLNNIGNAYLRRGQYDDALTYFERALQLREKTNVPSETALVVHNLATTSGRLGRYDQALAHHLRALELWRSAGDKREAAIEAYRMGEVFEYQGRFGTALQHRADALKTMRASGERSSDLVEVMSGYGSALSQAGRFDEAAKTLDEALSLARELKHQGTVAQTLNFRGANEFYRGEFAPARQSFEQALRTATTINDRHLAFVSRAGIAKLDVRERRAQGRALRVLAEEADSAGLKFVATDCAIAAGELLLGERDYRAAAQELERGLSRAERLGAKILAARAHHLLGLALSGSGRQTDAARHQRQAASILDEARKETGAESLVARSDLREIAR